MADLAQSSTDGDAAAYRRGVVLVLLAGSLWSTMGIGVRLMEVAIVWQILFYRSVALVPFLFVIITLRSGGRPFAAIVRTGGAGIVGGIGLTFAFSGGIYSIQTTTVANAVFLFAAAPFMAALLGRLLLGETVRRATVVAMAVALAGIAIMVAEGVALGYAIGNAAALLSALGFAVFTIALRWGRLDDMLPAVFLSGVFSIAVGGSVSLIGGHGLAVPPGDLSIALALGIFQLGAGLTVYTLGSKAVPAAELALLSMTEVLLAPVWVWLFLGESDSLATLIGGGVLMAAIAGNAISGLRRKPVPVM